MIKNPRSESVKCEDPPPDANGVWSNEGKNPGSYTKLSCNEGYELNGPESSMKCGESGMWEFGGALPECRSIDEINDEYIEDIQLDSPCRNSTNIISYYMTELNGLNIIVKLIIIGLYLKYKNKKQIITALIVLLAIHTLIHILIFIASLPPFCDSSNFEWTEGIYFNNERCHMKYELYNSFPFWFIDNIVPGIIAISLLYK